MAMSDANAETDFACNVTTIAQVSLIVAQSLFHLLGERRRTLIVGLAMAHHAVSNSVLVMTPRATQYAPLEELLVRQLCYWGVKVRVLHASKLLEASDLCGLRRDSKSRGILGVLCDKVATNSSRFKDNQIAILQCGDSAERVEVCNIMLVLRESFSYM